MKIGIELFPVLAFKVFEKLMEGLKVGLDVIFQDIGFRNNHTFGFKIKPAHHNGAKGRRGP